VGGALGGDKSADSGRHGNRSRQGRDRQGRGRCAQRRRGGHAAEAARNDGGDRRTKGRRPRRRHLLMEGALRLEATAAPPAQHEVAVSGYAFRG
jgi:hypothetical protein